RPAGRPAGRTAASGLIQAPDTSKGTTHTMMPIRELPGVGQQISLLGLGSYETLCYLEYQEIVRLVTTAAEAGVTLFDVAHYRRAPHTEVVLTRALQDAGLQ